MKKYIFSISILFIISGISIAQQAEKLSKSERKEQKKMLAEKQKMALVDLLKSKAWVIEAHTVLDRYNRSFQLNPTINFVGVKDKEGAIQLGFNGLIGWNGVGGITIDGDVTKYDLLEGKGNQGPTLSLRFQGRGVGSAMISISVNLSGQATARVTGDFGDRITFLGSLVSLDDSVVYKGQSLF